MKLTILQSGIFALDLTDDEIAAIFASQIARIITNRDEAVRSGMFLRFVTMAPAFLAFTIAVFARRLSYCALAIPSLAVGGVEWSILGDWDSDEAGEIGMLLMSEAGFDAAAAVSVEYKMADQMKQLQDKMGPGTRGGPVSSPHAFCESLLIHLVGRVRRGHRGSTRKCPKSAT